MKNRLYYGDNLDILRLYVDDESVDWVYLDPPLSRVELFKQDRAQFSSTNAVRGTGFVGRARLFQALNLADST